MIKEHLSAHIKIYPANLYTTESYFLKHIGKKTPIKMIIAFSISNLHKTPNVFPLCLASRHSLTIPIHATSMFRLTLTNSYVQCALSTNLYITLFESRC